MRKLILLPVLLLVLANTGMAQAGFKFGLKTGLNITSMTGTDVTWLEWNETFVREPHFKLGAHVGPSFSLGFGRHGNSSLTFDVLFSMKGATYTYKDSYFKYDGDTVATEIDAKESLTRLCVDVPILFRYRANMGLYGEAGIYLSVAASTQFASDDPRSEDLYEEIEETQYKPLDIGATAGLGWISEGGVGIGFRAFMGFLDQYQTWDDPLSVIDPGDLGRTTNYGFQLSGMYYFGWDKRRRR